MSFPSGAVFYSLNICRHCLKPFNTRLRLIFPSRHLVYSFVYMF